MHSLCITALIVCGFSKAVITEEIHDNLNVVAIPFTVNPMNEHSTVPAHYALSVVIIMTCTMAIIMIQIGLLKDARININIARMSM